MSSPHIDEAAGRKTPVMQPKEKATHSGKRKASGSPEHESKGDGSKRAKTISSSSNDLLRASHEPADEGEEHGESVTVSPVYDPRSCSREGPCKHKEGHKECPKNEFHRFADLPPELRIKVWAVVASVPRIVHATLADAYRPSGIRLVSNTPMPAVLLANSEARSEALKKYELSLFVPQTPGKIYFNGSADIVYWVPYDVKNRAHRYMFDDIHLLSGAGIHHLALDDETAFFNCIEDCDFYHNHKPLCLLHNLETLTIFGNYDWEVTSDGKSTNQNKYLIRDAEAELDCVEYAEGDGPDDEFKENIEMLFAELWLRHGQGRDPPQIKYMNAFVRPAA